MRKLKPLLILATLTACLALPAGALAQSAGDDQYTDPFNQGDTPAQENAPAEAPAGTPEGGAEPAPGGDGTAAPEVEAAQDGAPTLPRTGAPVVLLAAAGYALLLAGIAIRRQA